jgi:Tfp pilus assembly protein PilF
MGLALRQQGHLEEAQKELEKAVSLDPRLTLSGSAKK